MHIHVEGEPKPCRIVLKSCQKMSKNAKRRVLLEQIRQAGAIEPERAPDKISKNHFRFRFG